MIPLLAIFTKPYPLEERKPAQIKLALLFGLVVFLFLFLVRPFGNMLGNKAILINCSIAGLLTFGTITFDFLVLFPLFPKFFKEEKWTIGREIIWTLIIIVSIATANVLVGSFFWGNTVSFLNWLRMIFYTGIIALAPATTSILINQARLLKKYRKEVQVINEHLPLPVSAELVMEALTVNRTVAKTETITDKKEKTSLITIEAENEKDNLTIAAADFLAATSADNYVKVFYTENEKLKTAILRTTLKKLEDNTAALPDFFRCHRTAVVNLAAVQNVSGTAQGYRLHLVSLPEAIPVSRNLNAIVKAKLAAYQA
jgi:LytTr DNA-binding domain